MKPVKDIKDVEFEIKKALKILKSMPKVGPEQLKSHWPQYLNEENEKDISVKCVSYCKALPEEIDDMDEVLEDWLKHIEYGERNLVIMRNSGYGWKTLSAKLNSVRSNLYKKYVCSLNKILNYVLEKQRREGENDIL